MGCRGQAFGRSSELREASSLGELFGNLNNGAPQRRIFDFAHGFHDGDAIGRRHEFRKRHADLAATDAGEKTYFAALKYKERYKW
jgi:hypothetical protein